MRIFEVAVSLREKMENQQKGALQMLHKTSYDAEFGGDFRVVAWCVAARNGTGERAVTVSAEASGCALVGIHFAQKAFDGLQFNRQGLHARRCLACPS